MGRTLFAQSGAITPGNWGRSSMTRRSDVMNGISSTKVSAKCLATATCSIKDANRGGADGSSLFAVDYTWYVYAIHTNLDVLPQEI